MNKELILALEVLEKEKHINKELMLETIKKSLATAYSNNYDKADNCLVTIDETTGDFHIYSEKTVVEAVTNPVTEISLTEAKNISARCSIDDIINVEVKSKDFGRIATQVAKNVILQTIREEEKRSVTDEFKTKEKDIITGIVQRINGRSISINLGNADAVLGENEQVPGETFKPTERIKLYIVEVKEGTKAPRIVVSRTHPELVKRLFESEVTEIKDGTVEIMSIAREAGSRTKIAVKSNNTDVDPVGACVGLNGARVNSIVTELKGEKIDIINWNENPAILIENALSPAKVVTVVANEETKTAQVIVPDYQLSLAIGKEGQNARLAAKLTGFKVDIKSESQVAQMDGDFGKVPEEDDEEENLFEYDFDNENINDEDNQYENTDDIDVSEDNISDFDE